MTFSILVLLMATGCDINSIEPTVNDPSLIRGSEWQWTSYLSVNGVLFTDLEPHHYFLIDSNQVEGATGCNHFWANCELDATSIRFDFVVSQLLYCEPSPPEFTRYLLEPARYLVLDTTLTIYPSSGQMRKLIFKRR